MSIHLVLQIKILTSIWSIFCATTELKWKLVMNKLINFKHKIKITYSTLC